MRWSGSRVVSAAIVALALTTSAAASAQTLADRAAAIDAPRRGAEVALDGPLVVGHGEIAPAQGTRVYALLAGDGVRCGVLVDGKAKLIYRVDDRFSVPVAERNFRRGSSLVPEVKQEVLTVSEELTGAVVWGWGVVPGSGSTATAAAPALPSWAADLFDDRRFPWASHDLLAAEANRNQELRYALLHGDEPMLLHVDPAGGEENLFLLKRRNDPGTTFKQGVSPHTLAVQPIGRPWWKPVPEPLVAVHEAMRIENTGGETVRFTSRSRLRAQSPMAVWQPALVDRVWDDKGRQKHVKVESVRVDGKPADYLHDNDELLVTLGRTLAEGETAEVEVVYQGDLALRPYGNSYWVLGTYPWYPRVELGGEQATMEIEVIVPEALVPFASGSEVSRTVENGRQRLVTRLDKPMQFAVVAAGKWKVVSETRNGITCRVATYALLNEQAARKLIDKFFSSLPTFEAIFDEPYPFRDFSIVEIVDWGFGQAPPGIIFFTREFFTAPVRNRVFFQNRNARFLHEMAHGWWGHVAKMNTPEESWLCEAFADYTAALALWRLQGPRDAGDYTFDQNVTEWRSLAADVAPGATLYLTLRLAFNDDRSVEDVFRLRYAKGPLVVHALRLELQRQKGSVEEGDRHFIALLRAFLNRTNYGWGTTRELVATLNELTGTEWQPWFERYVYGTETPTLPKG